MEKHEEYAIKILSLLQDAFDDEDNSNHMNVAELEDENLKAFLHALSNVVPAHIYNKWCSENKNNLEWNHIANQLVFDYAIMSNNDNQTA